MEKKQGEKENGVEMIAQLLLEKQKTLAIAESCTGGLMAHQLTQIPGCAQFFQLGVVAYSNESKSNILGVSLSTLERFGAVSRQCAQEMAYGIRALGKSDIGLAITGISGPTGATSLKPLGVVYIAYVDKNTCAIEKAIFPEGRTIHQQKSTAMAFELLRNHLQILT